MVDGSGPVDEEVSKVPVDPRSVSRLVRLGAKYAPAAVEAARSAREPATQAAQRTVTQLQARRRALARATTVRDGSVLKTFDVDERVVWVVFSGEEPVATHPVTSTPTADLLRHVDLGKRIRPER